MSCYKRDLSAYQHCKQTFFQTKLQPETEPLDHAADERHTVAMQSASDCCLQSAGVQVNLFQHTLEHGTPDAVFPNNWFSTHPATETGQDSAMVLYPMKTKNRHVQVASHIDVLCLTWSCLL